MRILLDTHILLWAAGSPRELSPSARDFLENPLHSPVFSAASLWEITIKNSLGRTDFHVDAGLLRNGFQRKDHEPFKEES